MKTTKQFNYAFKPFTSVRKELSGGRCIWNRSAILNSDGNPIGLEQYMIQSGERVMRKPIVIERNTRLEIKEAQVEYANTMQRKYGKNWRKDKKGAEIKLNDFSHLRMLQRN